MRWYCDATPYHGWRNEGGYLQAVSSPVQSPLLLCLKEKEVPMVFLPYHKHPASLPSLGQARFGVRYQHVCSRGNARGSKELASGKGRWYGYKECVCFASCPLHNSPLEKTHRNIFTVTSFGQFLRYTPSSYTKTDLCFVPGLQNVSPVRSETTFLAVTFTS